MKRWLTVAVLAPDAQDDSYRPSCVTDPITGWVTAAASTTEALVKIAASEAVLATVKGTVWGDDATPLPAELATALRTEARRLGAPPDWDPSLIDVSD